MSCPVCFSGDDPVVRESVNAGLSVLLGVTIVVLGCFARFFVSLARRSARYEAQRRHDSTHSAYSPHSNGEAIDADDGHDGRYETAAVR